jgi:uncharacterized protein (TIGR02145 family)
MVAGGKLKTTGTIQALTGIWNTPNSGATNQSGFSGIPGGYRDGNSGVFYNVGSSGHWWSDLEASASDAWMRKLYYNLASSGLSETDKRDGCSIRCVKD